MSLTRRSMLWRGGLGAGGLMLTQSLAGCTRPSERATATCPPTGPDSTAAASADASGPATARLAGSEPTVAEDAGLRGDDRWEQVRSSFLLSRDYLQMSGYLLASHPKPVRDAIQAHRDRLDQNTAPYVHEKWAFEPEHLDDDGEEQVMRAAGRYLNSSSDLIALTDSTTAGLALVYSGLKIRPDQEILTTEHDHYATHESLRLRQQRTGVPHRKVRLYDHAVEFDPTLAIERIVAAIRPATRVLAVTWVHSISGVKLPVAALARALMPINSGRKADDRIRLVVDGVHGLGIENIDVEALGCDFFVAGTHKWLFGPRGTGIVWARADAWEDVVPMVPSFSTFPAQTPGRLHTPGGFHAFEHRWAVDAAFEFHMRIGKADIQARIHALASETKRGLQSIPGLRLVTPLSPEISSGFVCFQSNRWEPRAFVKELEQRKVLASTTPTRTSPDIRLAPGLLNNADDLAKTLEIVADVQRAS